MNREDSELVAGLLLALMEEDYVALWEIPGEVAGVEPGLDGTACRARGAEGVMRLLELGWARACWAADGVDEPEPIPDADVPGLLADPGRWAPTRTDVTGLRLEVTDAGERAFHQADEGRPWLTLADVPPGSWVGRQVRLMRDFLAHHLEPEEFRRLWYEARGQEIAYEERPGARIADAMDDLHEAIGDYDPSPTDREPEWLDEDQLRAVVRDTLTHLENLHTGPPRTNR